MKKLIVDPLSGHRQYEDELFSPEVGDSVHDDLTGKTAIVIRVSSDNYGNIGYWLDNDHLSGGRHPWEISPIIGEQCLN